MKRREIDYCNCEHAQYLREKIIYLREFIINGDDKNLLLEYISQVLKADKEWREQFEADWARDNGGPLA